MPLDDFLKRSMHTAIERIPVPTKFLRQRFFGRTFTFGTRHIDIDLVMPKRGMAPFVHPMHPGKPTASQGFTMKTYIPPTLKPTKLITPEDLDSRRPGATIYDEGDEQPVALSQLLGEKIAENNDEVAFRCEWMAAKALFSGQIPVVGPGYDHIISFDLPAGHNIVLAAGAKWDQATATPWDDLVAACRANRDDGQVVSDTVVFGSNAWKLFRQYLLAEEMMNQLDLKLGMIAPMPVDKYTTYLGSIRDADMSVDLFAYSAQYEDDDNAMKPFVPADEVFVGSSQATGNQELYGAILNLHAQSRRGQVFHDYEVKRNPSSIEILSQSAPLVALLEPKAGTRIKVV
ncbi:major capsid protein [Desulfobulbus elongatus]|uniref:major capsid protein n=1 Tax=Desulfobulbus elongatus TaxID=53332 RepID=UPI0004865575|nr:major capsid protein [Desulfobulbus elongatus]